MTQQTVVDVKRCAHVVTNGTFTDLITLRGDLTLTKKKIEAQLSDDKFVADEERARLLQTGMHGREVAMRIRGDNAEWRSRAVHASRIVDTWLSKIKTRLSQLTPAQQPNQFAAVVVASAGGSAASVALAINSFVERGYKVINWSVHDGDLVVFAAESIK